MLTAMDEEGVPINKKRLMAEIKETVLEREQDDKRWLSCDSTMIGTGCGSQSRRRKRPIASVSWNPRLRQKKLPKHWRENDDSLLTKLDLIQPTGGVTKQSSLLSYFGSNEKIKLQDSQAVDDPSVSLPHKAAVTLSIASQDCIDEGQTKGQVFSSEICHTGHDGLTKSMKENRSPEKEEQGGSDSSSDERFDLSPNARRLISLENGKVSLKASCSDDSHFKDGKKVRPVLSLRSSLAVETDDDEALLKTNSSDCDRQCFPQENLVEGEEQVASSKLHSSQYSLTYTEDEFSNGVDCQLCDSFDNCCESKKANLQFMKGNNDSVTFLQPNCTLFSEESLSFTNEEGNSHHLYVPLNESQKARKEVYKAEMGTLHFSESTPFS